MKHYLLAALGLALCGLAQAAGTAHYRLQESDSSGRPVQLRLEYTDTMLRMQTDPQQGGYGLVRADGTYGVFDLNGRQMVADAAQLGQWLRLLSVDPGKFLQVGSGPAAVAEFVSLDDLGRRESVAGVDGRVYRLAYLNPQGEERRVEAVLTQDPEVVSYTRRFIEAARRLQQSLGQPVPAGTVRLADEVLARGLGMLRVDNLMTLSRLDRTAPQAARFELPAQPMQLPDVLGLAERLRKQ